METTPNPTYPRCPYSKAGRRESHLAIGESVIGLSTNHSPSRCGLGYHRHKDITTVSRLAEYQTGLGLKTEQVTKTKPVLTTRTTPIGSLAEQGRKEMEAHKLAASQLVGIDNSRFEEYPFGPLDPEELRESAGIWNEVTLKMILGELRIKENRYPKQ